MNGVRAVFVLIVFAACGDNSTSRGPFDELPLDGTFTVGVSAPVHVARDKYGVAHISAQNVGDAAFVQGYVMAHDRLPQMDILRRFGAGTLAELFGSLDANVIDRDLEMRMHRMKPLATEAWATMQATPGDAEVVTLLQRFSDGVNAYAADLEAGKWKLNSDVLVSFDPGRFADWSPIDSLVLGRFQSFALSWTVPVEVDITEAYQKMRSTFDAATAANPAAYARRGISHDLFTLAPVGTVPTIAGFPNTDGSARESTSASRAVVAQSTFDRAQTAIARGPHTGPFGAFGPQALMFPYAGSNSWAVGPSLANGRALLAGDQHLQLPNPSVFYPTHLKIAEGEIDIIGITFAGIPGVILGSNGNVAWTSTTAYHDVNDVYLEKIVPCGGGNCVQFKGGQVPIETFTEEIKVGALGTILETRTATYERVPHHGPILPHLANHAIVPRTANEALSVRYTGHEPTFEIRALWAMAKAKNVEEGIRAFDAFTYGSQNWTMIDNAGSIGWTTQAAVPQRAAAALTWNAKTNPDGAAPWFVLPGDGSAEWEGVIDARYIPHAIDPASAHIITANSDPVGVTFDNDPLDGPTVNGRPLFLSTTYAAGLRTDRIAQLITEAGPTMTLEKMADIQHDSSSTVGAKLTPHLQSALALLDGGNAPTDAAAFVGALSSADRTRLVTARSLLDAWTFATPTALDAPDRNSAATALFNAWMHFFLDRGVGDEFDAMTVDMWKLDENLHVRTAYALLQNPGSLVKSPETGQPIVCDRYDVTGPDDSCTKLILMTLLDAMKHLESAQGFGTADTNEWRWGKMHRLTMKPLFPNPKLELPARGELSLPGFPTAGDNFVVNRADQGWNDLDFSRSADGAAQRFLATSEPNRPISMKWQLPTGAIYDPASPHYRDMLDNHYLPQRHFDAPYLVPEIVRDGEARWLFQ